MRLTVGLPFAVLGVAAYMVLLPAPSKYDLPLIVLVVFAVLAIFRDSFVPIGHTDSLNILVVLFVCSWVLSLLTTRDLIESFKLSAPILPACLLYYLIYHRAVPSTSRVES